MLPGIYLLLCILGFALPYSPLVMFLLDHGFDINLFSELMFANHISTSFSLDVIVSALVLLVFVFWEGTRLGMRSLWVFVVSTLTVGVSFTLPLFLLMRQRQLEKQKVS
ncbi:MAG: DUF2834 domain-containing protein [Fischerella sp.]|nr:DUF2834 domain-containing protein [Fischerella sp.]